MNDAQIMYHPIGIIHSPHTAAENTPIQPVYAEGFSGYAEIYPEYTEGLRDLEGFSHIYLIYHFHRSVQVKLTVKPFLQDVEHGIFATRSPFRPNAVGLSVVELSGIEGNILRLNRVDILDGTPLVDIKPCTVQFDSHEIKKNGWQDEFEEGALIRGKRGSER